MTIAIFFISAAVIGFAGTWLAKVADRLADRTGLGEALMGGVVLGASTSLAGSTLSVISAYEGLVDLSIGNSLGGIVVQTFFLCIADVTYTKANLEHAAASSTNLLLSALLIALLTIPLMALVTSENTWWGIHPATFGLFLFYVLGVKYVSLEKQQPMWKPKVTEKTVTDKPDEPVGGREILVSLWVKYFILVVALIASGYFLKQSGTTLAERWGISHIALGSLITGFITALPELIITLASVHRGAITLAVGGIIGGNTFDILFLAFSDIAYRSGSLYHQMTHQHIALLGLNILIMAVLLMGLVRREKFGFGKVGIETIMMAIIYIGGFFLILS